jgi:formyl-CoA transferase
MSISGEIESEPLPIGIPIADISTGMYACMSILAALHVRERTGEGQHVQVSLLESAISLLTDVASSYLANHEEPRRYGNGHPSLVPYQEFETRTHRIVVACGNDRLYAAFCHVIQRDDLIHDARYTTNDLRVQHRQTLIPCLQEKLAQRTADDWLCDLRKAGIPCAPVNTVGAMFHDPHVQESGIIWECEHTLAGTIQMVGSPMHFSKTPARLYKAPPTLGEDTQRILASKDKHPLL